MTALQQQLEALGFKPTKPIVRRNRPMCMVSLFVQLDEVDGKGRALIRREKKRHRIPNADLLAYHNTADRYTLMAMPVEAARHLC